MLGSLRKLRYTVYLSLCNRFLRSYLSLLQDAAFSVQCALHALVNNVVDVLGILPLVPTSGASIQVAIVQGGDNVSG